MRQLLQVLSLRKLVLEQDQDSRVEFFVRVEVRNVAGRQQDLVIQHEHVRELVGDIRNFAGKDLADFSIVDPILVLVLAVLHIGHRVLHQGVEERVAEIIQEVVDERGLDPYRIAFVFFDQQGFDLLLVGLTYVTVVRDNSDEQAVFEALEQMKGQVIFVELDAPLERGLVDRHPDRQEEASEDYVVSLLVDLELLFAEEIREDLCRLPKFPVAVEVARSLAEDFLVDFRVAHVFLLDFFLLRDIRQLKLHQIITFHLLVKRVQNLFVLLNAQKHLLFFFGRVKQLLVRAELRGGCFICPLAGCEKGHVIVI